VSIWQKLLDAVIAIVALAPIVILAALAVLLLLIPVLPDSWTDPSLQLPTP
jgi:hypothetical protein